MTRRIGDVEYGEYAFEHMRELYARASGTLDGELDPKIVAEAEHVHDWHAYFPGVVMKDGVE